MLGAREPCRTVPLETLPLVLALVISPAIGRAADDGAPDPVVESRHRLQGALGASFAGVPGASDGHLPDQGATIQLGAGYGYELAPWVELQGNLGYYHLYGKFRAVTATAGVRPHVHLSRVTELGASFRFGLFLLHHPDEILDESGEIHDAIWVGPFGTFSPDFRVWASPEVALELAPEIALGIGHSVRHIPVGLNYAPERNGLITFGGSLRVTYAF